MYEIIKPETIVPSEGCRCCWCGEWIREGEQHCTWEQNDSEGNPFTGHAHTECSSAIDRNNDEYAFEDNARGLTEDEHDEVESLNSDLEDSGEYVCFHKKGFIKLQDLHHGYDWILAEMRCLYRQANRMLELQEEFHTDLSAWGLMKWFGYKNESDDTGEVFNGVSDDDLDIVDDLIYKFFKRYEDLIREDIQDAMIREGEQKLESWARSAVLAFSLAEPEDCFDRPNIDIDEETQKWIDETLEKEKAHADKD